MTQIVADGRRVEALADAEGERVAAELAASYVDLRLRLARVLERLDRQGTYHLSSCSSMVQYAVRLGIPFADARAVLDLGRTIRAVDEAVSGRRAAPGVPTTGPGIEERIRSGSLCVDNASTAARIVAVSGLAKPGEDWIAKAESLPPPAYRQAVRARIEEVAQGVDRVVPVTTHVSERARDDFHRAGVIASREAGVKLTPGQTFTLVVRSYLEAHDDLPPRLRSGTDAPREGVAGAAGVARHGEPTGLRDAAQAPPRGEVALGAGEPPGRLADHATGCPPAERRPRRRSRRIPAGVRRRVLDRSGDRCEVPGCTHDTFVEFAHVRPHARGGGPEVQNLVLLCHAHHTQFDADYLVLSGWRQDGDVLRPDFADARGQPIGPGFVPAPTSGEGADRGAFARDVRSANPSGRESDRTTRGSSDRTRAEGPGVVDLAVAAEQLSSLDASVVDGAAEAIGPEPDDGSWAVAERPPPWTPGALVVAAHPT